MWWPHVFNRCSLCPVMKQRTSYFCYVESIIDGIKLGGIVKDGALLGAFWAAPLRMFAAEC